MNLLADPTPAAITAATETVRRVAAAPGMCGAEAKCNTTPCPCAAILTGVAVSAYLHHRADHAASDCMADVLREEAEAVEAAGTYGAAVAASIRAAAAPADPPSPCATVEAVRDDLRRRSIFGLEKYGQTVTDNPLPLRAWLQHAYEESLDHAIYLRRAMDEIDAQAGKKADRHGE